MWRDGNGRQKFHPLPKRRRYLPQIAEYFAGDACVTCMRDTMPSGTRYRQYAEECLRSAQAATPVQRAHLLRIARTWFEIADQTDASDAQNNDAATDVAMKQAM
jgi:hypothetical protein